MESTIARNAWKRLEWVTVDNMEIYNALREVPETAKKRITGGRLNGMTDISPMWRIKAMTEQFGACGIGWKYEITKQWSEIVCDDQVACFCNINLYVKYSGDTWSEAIPGTGGSMMVTKEKAGLRASDECYKMALTDAISVACKALGVGANVYWDRDSKYTQPTQQVQDVKYECCDCGKQFEATTTAKGKRMTASDVYRLSMQMNTDGKARCSACMEKAGTKKTS